MQVRNGCAYGIYKRQKCMGLFIYYVIKGLLKGPTPTPLLGMDKNLDGLITYLDGLIIYFCPNNLSYN